MRTGFIGLGRMGSRMARNLLAKGFGLALYDKNPGALMSFRDVGNADSYPSPAHVAELCRTVIVMVHNQDQCDAVLSGPDGMISCLHPGSTIILMSTLPPDYVSGLAEQLESKDVMILDAPVSGGVEGAEKATLTIMVAGPSEVVRKKRSILEAMGKLVVPVGEKPGLGQVTKVLNQMMYFTGIAIASEAVVAAAKAGIEPEKFVQAAGNGSGDNWALRNRIPLAWTNDYRSGGALDIAAKDLDAALSLCGRHGIFTPVAATVRQSYLAALGLGRTDADDSEYVRLVETLSCHFLSAQSSVDVRLAP